MQTNQLGRFGVVNLHTMNLGLLSKWVTRVIESCGNFDLESFKGMNWTRMSVQPCFEEHLHSGMA